MRPPDPQGDSKNPTFPRRLIQAKIALRAHYERLLFSSIELAHECCKHGEYTSTPGVNVVALGIGEKHSKGHYTGQRCVKIFVAKKYAKSDVPKDHFIDPASGGYPTDVVEIGYPVRRGLTRRTRVRPVQPGISVSPDYGSDGWLVAGTFGVVVAERSDRTRLHILSNNHVLSDEEYVPVGTRIFQPGTKDGGASVDRIGRLSAVVPLKYGNRRNWMDAALARLYSSTKIDTSILGIGAPRSAGKATKDMPVRKSGRTTGVTQGIVRELQVDVLNMQYEQGAIRMENVIGIEGDNPPFSKEGDSGSAIVDSRNRVVGLLFGGGTERDFAIPIHRILNRFRVRIAT